MEPSPSARYRPGYTVVAERILEMLVADGLRPGDHLGTETQLAQRLGVSRTVVREAVKTLMAVGRVRATKGRGLYVAGDDTSAASSIFFLPANLDHIMMLFEFRRVQEEAIVRLASVRATPPDIRAIRAAANENQAAAKAGDVEAFSRSDAAFHDGLAEAAHNKFLASAVVHARRLQHQAIMIGLRARIPGSPELAAEEHLRIVDAVAAGDTEAAVRAIGDHLARIQDDYQSVLNDLALLDYPGPHKPV